MKRDKERVCFCVLVSKQTLASTDKVYRAYAVTISFILSILLAVMFVVLFEVGRRPQYLYVTQSSDTGRVDPESETGLQHVERNTIKADAKIDILDVGAVAIAILAILNFAEQMFKKETYGNETQYDAVQSYDDLDSATPPPPLPVPRKTEPVVTDDVKDVHDELLKSVSINADDTPPAPPPLSAPASSSSSSATASLDGHVMRPVQRSMLSQTLQSLSPRGYDVFCVGSIVVQTYVLAHLAGLGRDTELWFIFIGTVVMCIMLQDRRFSRKATIKISVAHVCAALLLLGFFIAMMAQLPQIIETRWPSGIATILCSAASVFLASLYICAEYVINPSYYLFDLFLNLLGVLALVNMSLALLLDPVV